MLSVVIDMVVVSSCYEQGYPVFQKRQLAEVSTTYGSLSCGSTSFTTDIQVRHILFFPHKPFAH